MWLLLLVTAVVNAVIWAGLRIGWRPLRTVSWAVTVGAALAVIWSLLAYRLTGQHPVAFWQHQFSLSLDASLDVYRQLGWAEIELVRAERLVRLLFLEAAWGWLAAGFTVLALIFLMVQRRWFSDLPGARHPLTPFALWAAPEPLIFLLLAAMAAALWGAAWPAWMHSAVVSTLLALVLVYLLVGLAVVMFFLNRRGVSPVFKVGVVLLLGLIPALVLFIALLGVFDTWWDWRKVRPSAAPRAG